MKSQPLIQKDTYPLGDEEEVREADEDPGAGGKNITRGGGSHSPNLNVCVSACVCVWGGGFLQSVMHKLLVFCSLKGVFLSCSLPSAPPSASPPLHLRIHPQTTCLTGAFLALFVQHLDIVGVCLCVCKCSGVESSCVCPHLSSSAC